MREKYYNLYETYKHYPLSLAWKEFDSTKNNIYRVTTINWTYAEGDKSQVHKNTYLWTLEELIDFVGSGYSEVAEDVIKIEPF